MGSIKNEDLVQPGWIDVWRLWRHCLCRFGWYPLFVAPLVTCACLLDLYSSTGCDFIRMDIGFRPANDVWSDSHAQLGLFSFDSHETDKNKWKRSFNDGCQLYSENFVSTFMATDQTWHISRIMAYISGISSLVALATAWLLTITPLPASFLWPGVLLPAVVLSMLSGAAKFFFFDAQICKEPLWFVDETSEPVAAESCEIGESSVFGIASVAAYFFCTILICFRSPQKRTLDENFGKRVEVPGSTITQNTPSDICNDPERGHANVPHSENLGIERRVSNSDHVHDSQQTMRIKNHAPQVIQHGQHTRSTSDVTWSTGSNKNIPHGTVNERSRNLGVLSPPIKAMPEGEPMPDSADGWNSYGRPIVVTINDNGHAASSNYSKQSLSYSDGSTTQSSGKSPGSRGTPGMLPPRHNGKSTINHPAINGNRSNDYDAGSVGSRVSRISLTDTQASDELSALGMNSYSTGSSNNKSAPSVVAIPRRSRGHSLPGASPGSSQHSSSKKLRYPKHRREDRNDVFLNELQSNSGRLDGSKRDLGEHLPPLDELSSTKSLDMIDHGDLINKCVRDLQMSFANDDNGFRTM
ncbi:hypothetical protein ACHAXR_003213 [Thalassiosira sp. AJA248-18]